MKRRPVTEETKASIEQRLIKPGRSMLNCENPIDILRAEFSLREIAILTGFSLKTIQRQKRAYNTRGHTHKTLCLFAMDYLASVSPRTELIKELHERVKGWYDDKTHNARG